MLKLEYIRGAKVQIVDVQPGERMISRIIHRHLGPAGKDAAAESVASKSKPAAGRDELSTLSAYSVGVQTRDGSNFQVDVHIASDLDD